VKAHQSDGQKQNKREIRLKHKRNEITCTRTKARESRLDASARHQTIARLENVQRARYARVDEIAHENGQKHGLLGEVGLVLRAPLSNREKHRA
jgi:hypothetical protein